MKNIKYNNNGEISNLICRGFKIHISDFKYTAKDGITYLMVVNNKGYDGQWHVIQSLIDNKLYATNNLWSISDDENKFNSIVIKTKITKEEILKNYDEIIYINNLNFFNDTKLQEVKDNCEISIKKHFENEYIQKNTIQYLSLSDDYSRLEIHLYSEPISINNSLIKYYVHYGSIRGDNIEKYNTIDLAILKCSELIYNYYNYMSFDNNIKNEIETNEDESCSDNDEIENEYNEEIISKLLSIGNTKNNKNIIQLMNTYGIYLFNIQNNTFVLTQLIYKKLSNYTKIKITKYI